MTPPRRGSFTGSKNGQTILFRTAAAATETEGRHQKLARALPFDVTADRYRPHD